MINMLNRVLNNLCENDVQMRNVIPAKDTWFKYICSEGLWVCRNFNEHKISVKVNGLDKDNLSCELKIRPRFITRLLNQDSNSIFFKTFFFSSFLQY